MDVTRRFSLWVNMESLPKKKQSKSCFELNFQSFWKKLTPKGFRLYFHQTALKQPFLKQVPNFQKKLFRTHVTEGFCSKLV